MTQVNIVKRIRRKIRRFFYQKIFILIGNETYIQILYFFHFFKFIDLKKPKTFNEKIQYLKLKQTNKIFSDLVDKYKVRDFIKKEIGEKYLTKLYWVGIDSEKINFKELPSSFVIKCNHGSGYNILIKDKTDINIKNIKRQLNIWLNDDYWKYGREMQYKNIEKKIIIEEFLHDKETIIPNDYKFFCFNGKVKFIQVDTDRFNGHFRNIFDIKWNELEFGIKYKKNKKKINKPGKLNEMIILAEQISKDFSFVRIDFYEVNGKIYFGEITFSPGNGLERFFPNHNFYDNKFGELINL